MRHYVFVTEINDKKLEAIYREFKSAYKVDLDNKKYSTYGCIEEKWNAIMSDTFLRCSGNNKEMYVSQFLKLLFSALYGEQSDIIRPYSIEVKRRQDAIHEFKGYIMEMQTLLSDYSMYEPDVWMNAYLSIQYMKAISDLPDGENIVKSAIAVDHPYHAEAKGIAYIIPFEDYQEGFCEKFVKKIAGKDQIQILGAYIYPHDKEYHSNYSKEGFYGYINRVELNLDNIKYTRWKQKKVYSLEKSKEFETEDKVMFHKTINGVLVRNLVDTMISTERVYDVEDYLYLLDKLCMSKSLNWQNLIGCLYIEVSCYKRELMALDLWADIEIMFEAWFMNLEAINRHLELLVEGLIYVIYKQDRFFDNVVGVEERCKDALEKIEKNPITFSEKIEKLIQSEWITQKETLRVSKSVEINHRQYYWIYAIMQRYVIDSLTPYKCDELREKERDWNDIVSSIASYYIAAVGLENQNNINDNKADKGTDNMMEGSKGNINVGEICSDLLKRKREKSKDLMEDRITKEDLLNEIKSKLIKIGRKDDDGKISDKILKEIWQIFIDMKVRETHVILR